MNINFFRLIEIDDSLLKENDSLVFCDSKNPAATIDRVSLEVKILLNLYLLYLKIFL